MGAGHSHDHGHSHAPADFGQAFGIGVVLNLGFVALEAIYGFLSDSMALVADAGHNLSDVMSLLLAWGAGVAAKKPATARFTWGPIRSTKRKCATTSPRCRESPPCTTSTSGR